MSDVLDGFKPGLMVYVAVGLTLTALALGGVVAYQRLQIKGQNQTITTIQADLDKLNTNFLAYKQNAQATIDEMARQNQDANDRLAKAQKREKEIRNVPKEQDGGVPPVMVDSLKRLQ